MIRDPLVKFESTIKNELDSIIGIDRILYLATTIIDF